MNLNGLPLRFIGAYERVVTGELTKDYYQGQWWDEKEISILLRIILERKEVKDFLV